MLGNIICIFIGAMIGVGIVAIVSANRPDDYRDGYNDGYRDAQNKYKNLP